MNDLLDVCYCGCVRSDHDNAGKSEEYGTACRGHYTATDGTRYPCECDEFKKDESK